MAESVRCIATDGTLFVTAIDATDIVNRAAEIHQTSAVTSAALGRLLCAVLQGRSPDHRIVLTCTFIFLIAGVCAIIGVFLASTGGAI